MRIATSVRARSWVLTIASSASASSAPSDAPPAESARPRFLEAMKDDAKGLDARVAYWEDGAELARALRAAAT